MARRRPLLRKPRGPVEHVAAAAVGVALAVLLLGAAQSLLRSWPFLAAVAVLALAAAARQPALDRARTERLAALRLTLAQVDALDDQAFEYALRDLLIRDGWSARKVGQQGDQAADVTGQHPSHGRIVLQAKHTRVGAKVGVHVMYEVKGTAGPVHGADIAVVVTNGTLTRDAMAWGDRHRIHWIDRPRLETWADRGTPLHDLLALPGRPAKRRIGWRRVA
ncbi:MULTISPECIES: restriction endonuclease [unclassified Kitasatospora]|uniref:restriction endonuclease n=1 Tax=unclassified Kitasatospora TaxID=2633591 RepID=UPI00382B7E25